MEKNVRYANLKKNDLHSFLLPIFPCESAKGKGSMTEGAKMSDIMLL